MIGYLNGYRGLLLGKSIDFPESVKNNFSALYEFGGSPIGNSRVKLTNIQDCINRGYVSEGEAPLKVAADQLKKDNIDILHTIGGDDTNTMAAQLSNYLKENNGYIQTFNKFQQPTAYVGTNKDMDGILVLNDRYGELGWSRSAKQ